MHQLAAEDMSLLQWNDDANVVVAECLADGQITLGVHASDKAIEVGDLATLLQPTPMIVDQFKNEEIFKYGGSAHVELKDSRVQDFRAIAYHWPCPFRPAVRHCRPQASTSARSADREK